MTGAPNESSAGRAWHDELGEASLRPEGDPHRAEIEARVRARGGQALAHWEALLAEGAAWRAALPQVDPPAELAERLRAIPHQNRPRSRVLPRWTRRRLVWPTAGVLLIVAGVLWFLGRDDAEAAVQQVALLALNDHLDTHDQDVWASDPVALARDLQAHIPFPVRLPDVGGVITPVGGRKCTLGSHTVAFTAWRGAGGRLSMVQLRRADFGLPDDLTHRIVRPRGNAAQAQPLDVLFFGRGAFLWVVVADDGEDLRRVAEALDGA